MAESPNSPGNDPNGATLALMEKTIASLEQQLVEMKQAQSSANRIYVLGSVIMVTLLLVWAFFLYTAVKANLTQEEVQKAVMNEFEEMRPALQDRAREVAYAVGPVYQKLALKKVEELRPKLEESFKKEAEGLSKEVQTRVTTQIEASLKHVGDGLKEKVKEKFPALTPEKLDALADKMTADFTDQGAKLQVEVKDIYMKEAAKVQGVMDKFPLADYEKVPKYDVEKLLVRKLLQLVDHEIEVSGTPDGIDVQKIIPAATN